MCAASHISPKASEETGVDPHQVLLELTNCPTELNAVNGHVVGLWCRRPGV
jgi:hypothetical protein